MALTSHDDAALIILANFASPTALDLREHAPARKWAEQAPREIWLTRPGDVLLTSVPLSEPFTRYACAALGIRRDSVHTITLRDDLGVSTAETVHHHDGLVDRLREYGARRPGTRLLPIVLDAPTMALAADLGTPVCTLGRSGPAIGPEALAGVAHHNTKAGFRATAEELGMRLPHGRVCDGAELPSTVRDVLARYARVVVKPDRAAGGHGLRFVGRDEPLPGPEPAGSRWIVEEYVAHTASVSAQFEATPAGPRFRFDGEMRTVDGAFTGYHSPAPGTDTDRVRGELHGWGRELGHRLARGGYFGPYDIDAVVAEDGLLYATECNVRRTATTTPHAMVGRLTASAGHPAPAWIMATAAPGPSLTFAQALDRLRAGGLDYDAGRGEGVVLYADRPAEGTGWRYVAVAPDRPHLAEVESRLSAALG
ncbi:MULTISPECIES: peptide ligase PGM1-related protein [unclassified Streptomyces]|uniref:preATP grasp domain-containing protein n=1 Tax=unclassified Streptomyces TaxID=2593676 RepID=UPI002E281943|nr:peptide ligase PGM1-related protein [Streptomyces sp. NBC_00223]